MEKIREFNAPAYTYIMELDRRSWANAFIEARCYDMLTSNVVECTNSLFKGARSQPITHMVEGICEKLKNFFQTCSLELSRNVTTRLTPWGEKYLEEKAIEARNV